LSETSGRVLDTLGRGRSGQLLKALDEVDPFAALVLGQRRLVQQQNFPEEIERLGRRATQFPRLMQRDLNVASIDLFELNVAGVDIGSIDRKGGDHFDNRSHEIVLRRFGLPAQPLRV